MDHHTVKEGPQERPLHSKGPESPQERPLHSKGHESPQERPLHSKGPGSPQERPLHSEGPVSPQERPLHSKGPESESPQERPLHSKGTESPQERPLHSKGTESPQERPLHSEGPESPQERPLHSEGPVSLQERPLHSKGPESPQECPQFFKSCVSQSISPLEEKVDAVEGETAALSCRYSGSAYYLFWYRQHPGSRPEFLLRIDPDDNSVRRATPPFPRLDAAVKRGVLDLKISSTAVSDSVLYYCALKPTVTRSPSTLYKNSLTDKAL
ncbi:hypothetical protein NFI96_029968, partial [Prochilodus magdalenae]